MFSSFIVWYLFMAGVGSGAFIVAAFSFVGCARHTVRDRFRSSSGWVGRFGKGGRGADALAVPLPFAPSTGNAQANRASVRTEQARGTIALTVASLGMIVAMLSLVFDFAEPLRIWRVMLTPFSSLASFGASVLVAFTLLVLLFTLAVLFGLRLPRWLFWSALGSGSVLALAVMLYAGFLLAGMVAIDVWHTWLLPLLFVVSSLSCGLAAVLFFEILYLSVRERGFSFRWRALLVLGLLECAVLGGFLIERGAFSSTARESVLMLLVGEQAAFFLGGVVAAGLMVPLLSHLVFRWLPLEAVTLFATACVLVGGFFLRYCLVGVGRFAPILPLIG